MRRDELINEVSQALMTEKQHQQKLILTHQFNALTKMVAIRVKTKAEAETMLEIFKQEFYKFPYPFGPYLTWIEIAVDEGFISYVIMPSEEMWPHWQIYMNPGLGTAEAVFLWSPDGSIGPHPLRPGGEAIGPTVYAYQDGQRCIDCPYFETEPDNQDVIELVSIGDSLPPALAAQVKSKACILTLGKDPGKCRYSNEFWDSALLPISIIMYIALAPTRELDVSWRQTRSYGKGRAKIWERGHYVLTPIKKGYIKQRIDRQRQGTSRQIEIPSFVRGHRRRAHKRRLSRTGEYTDVRESWVNPHWRGTPWDEFPPHYSLAWGEDARLESAKKLMEER